MKKKIALMLAAVMLLTTTGSMAYASELSDAAIVGEDRSDFPGEVTGEAAVYSDVSEDAAALIAESTTYAVDIDVTYGQTAARSMLDMINALRTGDDAWYWSSDDTTKVVCSGLSELTYSYELEKIAMQRAAEIAISYSHTRPDNSTCWTAYDEVTFIYYAAGENISAGFTDASSVFASWSEEDENYSGQGHRRNMLDSYFNTVGIGHVYYNGYHYWVQEFAYTPNSSTATAANDSVTTVTVNVASSNISSVTLTADPSSCSLTVGESAALPVLTTKIKLSSTWPSSMLKVAADYTWTVADSSCAVISGDQLQAKAEGSTTLTASALGDTLEIPVTVESASASELIDLSDASVELSQSDYTYDGEEKTPTVTVKYNSVALNAGTDYTVAYSNNVDVGTATVTVTGAGDYTGTITKTFTISASQTESESESESESETESEMESETEAELKNGLALNPEDGIWYYYVDDVIDTTFTGIAAYEGGSFFVANGVLCSGANGLNLYNGVWYFLASGQVQTQYTDLALYDGEWFYITNGVLDTSKTGLVPYDGETFLVAEGHLLTSYNGLWQNSSTIGGDNKWYFIAAGQVQNVSQIVMYDGEWFVVENGVLASDYNGEIVYDGVTFQVVAGQLYG